MTAIAEPKKKGTAKQGGNRPIPVSAQEPERMRVRPRQLVRSKWNREDFDEGKLTQLIESIRERGIIQPVIVRDWYPETIVERVKVEEAKARGEEMFEIVAGERRWRAAEVLDVEIPVLVRRGMSDEEAIELQAIENMHREDLNPLDEAEKYRQLLDMYTGRGMKAQEAVEQICGKLQRSRSAVYAGLNLLKLPEFTRTEIRAGRLPKSHAELLTKISNAQTVEELTREITRAEDGTVLDAPMSFRELKGIVDDEVERERNRATWEKMRVEWEAAGKRVLTDEENDAIVRDSGKSGFYIEYQLREQWVTGDMTCYLPGAVYQLYEQLWKEAPQGVLGRTSYYVPVILYDRAAADEAVKAGGKLKNVGGRASNKSPEEAARERDHRVRKQVFEMALGQIVVGETLAKESGPFWRLFIRLLLDGGHSHAWKALCKRHDWPADDHDAVYTEIEKHSPEQIRAIALEFLLHVKCTPNPWHTDSWCENMAAVCKRHNVDLARLEQTVRTSGGGK